MIEKVGMNVRYNILTYLIGEGFSNVFKSKKQAMTSLGMMCITMLIFGVFFVIGQNLNHFVEEIESEQGMQVFIKVETAEAVEGFCGNSVLSVQFFYEPETA